MELKSYYDKARNITLNVGDVVHWYKYSQDMIIMDGGYGLLVDISALRRDHAMYFTCSVLVESGQVVNFCPEDLDIEEIGSDDE